MSKLVHNVRAKEGKKRPKLGGVYTTGNDKLHLMTSDKRQVLYVSLVDFEGNAAHARYDSFKVESAGQKYNLSSLGTYTGTAGR